MIVHLLTVLMALVQNVPLVPSGTASVEGIVQNLASGVPVADAGVELRNTGNNSGKPYVAVTTADGRFSFSNIPPGEYRLSASHGGYIRSEFGQRGPHGRGIPITLAAGQDLKAVGIGLTETGSISGHIRTADGEPIANVQVQALKVVYFEGRQLLVTAKGAVTNDLGEYRLYWLPPDRYLVMAIPLHVALPDNFIQVLGEDHTSVSEIPSPTGEFIVLPEANPSEPHYFPGTTDIQFASAVAIRSAESARDVDMVIGEPRGHRVKGRVTNLPSVSAAGLPDAVTFVRLRPRDSGSITNQAGPLGLQEVDMRSGVFEFRGVRPGSYFLDATGDGLSSGRISVDVGDSDVEGLVVSLDHWFDVPVRVSVDRSPNDFDNTTLNRVFVELRAVGVAGLIAEQNPLQASGVGQFVMHDVSPFDYRIMVHALPESTYVKTVRLNGVNVLDSEFQLNRPPLDPIEVVLGLNAGSANGTVTGAGQASMENVVVALVPDAPRRERQDLYKNTTSGKAGSFNFRNIAPGDYRVYAFEDVVNGAWQNSEFITKFENFGKAIHIEEGSNETISVSMIPAGN